jgi:hypothetical protein
VRQDLQDRQDGFYPVDPVNPVKISSGFCDNALLRDEDMRDSRHHIQANRRQFLYGLGATLGTVAWNALLRDEPSLRAEDASLGPLAVKPPHVPAKVKNCIFLFLEGGPSHLDTFDPKPKLKEMHAQKFQRNDKFASAMASGTRYYVQSPFEFGQAGEAGIWMSEPFEHLPSVADELCIYHGLQAESINHPTACYHINTGNRFGGDPALGSWVT